MTKLKLFRKYELSKKKEGICNITYAAYFDGVRQWSILFFINHITLYKSIINKVTRSKYMISYKYVCNACALAEDFKIMPSSDLTEIGERGVNLSGGQKQRVSLARAVYAKKELYLLDDPLSAVDSHVGKHIFENCIKLALRHHTVLFVTHQLQYLKDCDYIIYMEDGKFAEEETYDKLINDNNEFSNIVKKYHNEHEDKKELSTEEVVSQASIQISENEEFKVRENYLEKEVQLAEEGKIIMKEDKVKGSVSLSTYLDFCRFGGGVVPTLAVLISTAAAIGIQIFAEYCLLEWLSYLKIINDSEMMVVGNVTLANANEKADLYKTLYWAIALSTFFTSVLSVFFTVYFVLKASTILHNTVLEKIFHAPINFFQTTPVGRIMNRLSKDVDEIDNFLPLNVTTSLQTLFRNIGPIIFICVKIPYYTIMAVIQVVFMYLLSIIYRKVVRAVKRIENVTRSPIYSHLTATMEGLISIRAFRNQEEFRNDFSKHTDTNTNAMFLYFGTLRWFSLYCDFLCITGVVAVSVVALLLTDSMPAAVLAMSIAYLIKVADLLQYTCQQIAETESRFTSVERVNHYVNTLQDEGEYETTDRALISSWPADGVVEFENVSFRYRENMPLALKDLSFCINDKEKIGIVGRTGAGKSSLSVILYRLADIEKGNIKISGVDIKDIGLYDLRNSLSMVPQDPVLFIGTIRYNLDPFSKSTDDELWNVLEKAHIKTSVSLLPDKLESIVAENGSNFSVGERQLICMARALLRKSKVLILDEATAAIDANTDSKIQAMIKEAFCDCTVLTIAHRLNTIMNCDRILLMEKGEVQSLSKYILY